MLRTSRPLVALVASGALIFALAGCSGSSTKAADCKALQTASEKANVGLNSTFSNLGASPTTAEKKLQSITDTFDAVVMKVGDSGVKAAADKADSALKTMTAEVKKDLDDPANADQSALETASTQVDSDFAALTKACK
jgi:hypothetical protein